MAKTDMNISGLMIEYAPDDIENCAAYVVGSVEGKTKEAIAAEQGVTRQGLYVRINKWKENGLLEKVEQSLLLETSGAIGQAIHRVISQWPAALDRMMQIVLHGKEHNAVLAFELLQNTVVKPVLQAVSQPGSAEKGYAESEGDLDPMGFTTGANSIISS